MLLNKGANVNVKNNDGISALHIAVKNHHIEIVELLLKYGARINSRDNKGKTALHYACVSSHRNAIKLLLKYGARVNSQDNYGRTALHYACFKGHILAVDELLKHGSDINVMSKKGRTALCGINRYSGGKIAELIACLIVKMKTANLYVSENNLRWYSEITKDIYSDVEVERETQDRYLRELSKMRNEKIANSNISFYDILVKRTSSLAACMRNENVVEVSKTASSYGTQFLSYDSILKSQFRKGLERNKLLEPASICFNSLFNRYTELPYTCAEKILNYVSNEDLINLIDAFEPDCIS